jgi:hypothetical protein
LLGFASLTPTYALYFHLGQAPPLAPLTEIDESLTKVSSYGVASIHAMTVGVSKAIPNIVIFPLPPQAPISAIRQYSI